MLILIILSLFYSGYQSYKLSNLFKELLMRNELRPENLIKCVQIITARFYNYD